MIQIAIASIGPSIKRENFLACTVSSAATPAIPSILGKVDEFIVAFIPEFECIFKKYRHK
jgi:hypothetical protein